MLPLICTYNVLLFPSNIQSLGAASSLITATNGEGEFGGKSKYKPFIRRNLMDKTVFF